MVQPEIMAGLWGITVGFALFIGAAVIYRFKVSPRVVASIMAFGAGVLISAITVELVEEAFLLGSFNSVILGFFAGAGIFTGINLFIALKGGKGRKSSILKGEEEGEIRNSTAIAVGSIIDAIPESIAIGLTMISGTVSYAIIIAVFLSNIPEGLSSTAGMKKSGNWTTHSIFGLWTIITIVTAIGSIIGFTLFRFLPPHSTAIMMSFAAGSILVMIIDNMVPEAYSETYSYAGLITVIGFMISFFVSKMPI